MNCKHCGKEIHKESVYCPLCGKKQTEIFCMTFQRKSCSEDVFIETVNRWFLDHPNITNVSCRFHAKSSFGMLANQYKMEQFSVEYELCGENDFHYRLVKEERFALWQKNTDDILQQWMQEHPHAKVLNYTGGTHSRGQAGSVLLGGVGAMNRMTLYIFCAIPKNQDLTTKRAVYCGSCGKKIGENSKFCPHCGNHVE